MIVMHHMKSEKVKRHLQKCMPFKKSLAGMVSSDIPAWMTIKGRRGSESVAASYSSQQSSKNMVYVLDGDNSDNNHADVMRMVSTNHAFCSASSPSTLGTTTTASRAPDERSGLQSNSETGRKKTKTMKDFIVPPMTPHAKAQFHKTIAMHFYMTGNSFYRMEEVHLVEALRQLRPDVTLPSRRDVGGKLLQHAYNEVKQKVNGWLDQGAYGSLTTDGWSNIKNESIVNYMFVSGADSMSVFLESIETGGEAHTADFLAADKKRVIESLPPNAKIAGVVMDNTSANKAAWRLLQDSYPSRFFQGCVAHALHLLVKDIFAATKAKRGREVPDYPDNYPFEPLLNFIAQVKKVVSYFHQHHVPKALLTAALKAKNLRMLARAAATRWGSIGEMMKTCLGAEAVCTVSQTVVSFSMMVQALRL